MINPKNLCPCHSQKCYEECCKRYHEGAAAENALILMRSRYSAYALQLADDTQTTWKTGKFQYSYGNFSSASQTKSSESILY